MLDNKKVTVCMTAFNRFDLLKQTLDSFMKLTTYPIDRYVVIEDSAKPEVRDNILREYGERIDLIFNEETIGQAPSLDKMYKTVTTPYIFHTEEDYLYEGNTNFVQDSIDLLEERKDVHQIWARHQKDINNQDQFEPEIFTSAAGVQYRMVSGTFAGWCGFSWYPGLRRKEDYVKMFPNGFGEFISPEYRTSGVQTEAACNTHAKNQGYRGAILLNGGCYNRGVGREAYK